MRLEHVSAVLRPRSDSEAVDLGLALVRTHSAGLIKAWATLLVPLWGLIILVLHDYPSTAFFLAWWLKPLYDRIIIFYLGRSLFGDPPTMETQLRAWPRLLTRNLGQALFLHRLSNVRTFVMPVLVLEGLKGKSRSQRTTILKRHGGAAAANATFIIGLLELAVLAGLATGMKAFIPEDALAPLTDGSLLRDPAGVSLTLLWYIAGCYLAAIAIIEPFYAGAGFGLYLNSRTHLEGWDVELSFRRLEERLRNLKAPAAVLAVPETSAAPPSMPPVVQPGIPLPLPPPLPPTSPVPKVSTPSTLNPLLLLLAAAAVFLSAGPARATADKEAKDQIKSVMERPDFNVHTENYREWQWDSSPPTSSTAPSGPPAAGWDWSWLHIFSFKNFFSGGWTAIALRMLLLLLVLGLGSALMWALYKNRHHLKGLGPRPVAIGPRTVLGMEVAPDSLPDDIPTAAWEAWSRGETTEAVGLLYRGSLSWLIRRAALPIRESDTEGDCLRLACTLPDKEHSAYFASLTNTWLGTTYGSLPPSGDTMRDLCHRWPFSLQGKPAATGGRPSPLFRSASLVMFAGCILCLTSCGKFIEKERTLGYQGEARQNPWLAAGRFLEANDYHVASKRGIMELPHSDTLLVVPADAIHSEVQARTVLRWVQDGGHLIYLTHGGGIWQDDWSDSEILSSRHQTAPQPLLTAMDLKLVDPGRITRITSVEVHGVSYRVALAEEVNIDANSAKYPLDFVGGPKNSCAVLSLLIGQGRVTVVTDGHAFRNRFIGNEDHAALLLSLAKMEPCINSVRFLRAGRISLWDMLVERGWMALIAAAALVLFWLWRYLPRFGPVQALSNRSQRRFATHLEEAGAFFWKHRMSGTLLEFPRQAVIAAARRHAIRENEAQFIPLLSARSGVPPNRISDALSSGELRDPRDFIRQMADLQKILQSF